MKNKLKTLDIELQKEFKEVYKYIYDVKPLNWEDLEIDEKTFSNILDIASKKLKGIDVTFDIGFKYFRGNKIQLEKGVFVPQYDTEEILEPLLNSNIKEGRLLEVGTGSGAIPISIAKETKFKVDSIDINLSAIKLAKLNAKENKAEVNFFEQDIFEYFPKEKYDVLISNPPYIKYDDPEVEEWVKGNQPSEALYADNDGYLFYQHIIINHNRYLNPGGMMIFEIGHKQAKAIKLIAENSNVKEIEVIRDIDNQNDRFIVIYI